MTWWIPQHPRKRQLNSSKCMPSHSNMLAEIWWHNSLEWKSSKKRERSVFTSTQTHTYKNADRKSSIHQQRYKSQESPNATWSAFDQWWLSRNSWSFGVDNILTFPGERSVCCSGSLNLVWCLQVLYNITTGPFLCIGRGFPLGSIASSHRIFAPGLDEFADFNWGTVCLGSLWLQMDCLHDTPNLSCSERSKLQETISLSTAEA